jgi:hypothetical protein
VTKYRSSASEYASLYGVTRSTIFRWKSKGAPLDDPGAMRVFRANEKSRTRVSKSNHRCTSSPQTSHTNSLTSCAPNQPETVKKTKVNHPHGEVGKHAGMRPGIRRLQEAEVQRYAGYQEAVASGDGAEIKARQEVWLNVFERLRRVEATNPELKSLRKSQSQSQKSRSNSRNFVVQYALR